MSFIVYIYICAYLDYTHEGPWKDIFCFSYRHFNVFSPIPNGFAGS